MQKKIAGLVLAVSLIAPLSVARAAEVDAPLRRTTCSPARLLRRGDADDDVGVRDARENQGHPRDSIAVIISGPSGFSFLSGVLPAGALTINKKNASLDVVIGDIAVIDTTGDLPADGVVSVDWAAGDVERSGGDVVFKPYGVRVHIHGHRTFAAAAIDGSVLGTALLRRADGPRHPDDPHQHDAVAAPLPETIRTTRATLIRCCATDRPAAELLSWAACLGGCVAPVPRGSWR